jgi:hypothetical protein
LGSLVLLGAVVAMLLLLVDLGRWLTFWYDEWNFVLDRADPSIETLLAPHVDHLSIVPVLLYEALLRIAGLGSYWPWLVALWACHLLSVALLYRITSRFAGTWLAVLAALSLLTLGPAFEDLLQAFQVSFLLSTAFGLLAVERLTASHAVRWADVVIAAPALVIAAASSSVGILFLGLLLLWSVLDGRRLGVVAGLPALAGYALWYVLWRHATSGPIGGLSTDPTALLQTFFFGLGAAICAVVGLAPYLYAPLGWLVWAGVATRLAVERLSPSALGVASLAALVAMYALQAVFRSGLGIEHAARSAYLYPAAIFLWIAAADIFRVGRRPRIRRSTVVAIALGAVVVAALNLTQLVGSGRAMRGLRVNELAILRLISTNGDASALVRDVSPDPELMPQVTADRYLAAVRRFGEPQLAVEPAGDAFEQLIQPGRLNRAAVALFGPAFDAETSPSPIPLDGLRVAAGTSRPGPSGCIVVEASGAPVVAFRLEAGDGFTISPVPSSIRVGIRPTDLADAGALGSVRGGVMVAAPPPLAGGQPWFVEAVVAPDARICRVTRTAESAALRLDPRATPRWLSVPGGRRPPEWSGR